MKNILFFLCITLGFSASAQEKKKDSVIYEYKPRIYKPFGGGTPKKMKKVKPLKKREIEKLKNYQKQPDSISVRVYSEQA
jgi:hypothetical protein